jgi:hypothetical protein
MSIFGNHYKIVERDWLDSRGANMSVETTRLSLFGYFLSKAGVALNGHYNVDENGVATDVRFKSEDGWPTKIIREIQDK